MLNFYTLDRFLPLQFAVELAHFLLLPGRWSTPRGSAGLRHPRLWWTWRPDNGSAQMRRSGRVGVCGTRRLRRGREPSGAWQPHTTTKPTCLPPFGMLSRKPFMTHRCRDVLLSLHVARHSSCWKGAEAGGGEGGGGGGGAWWKGRSGLPATDGGHCCLCA